uniref:Uncharacterized protein n=1 Tax=Mycena chlorophos TaxID=658473 RepID=A0ABQ0LSK4_MYCCL|nr:predicted protein [Mycena chlorophos]
MPKRPPTPTPLPAELARPRRVARTETMATVTTNASESEWTSPMRPRLGSVGWSPQGPGPIAANGTLNGMSTAKEEPVTPRLSIVDGTRTLVLVAPRASEKSVNEDAAEGDGDVAEGSKDGLKTEVVYTSDADERENLDIPLSPGMETTTMRLARLRHEENGGVPDIKPLTLPHPRPRVLPPFPWPSLISHLHNDRPRTALDFPLPKSKVRRYTRSRESSPGYTSDPEERRQEGVGLRASQADARRRRARAKLEEPEKSFCTQPGSDANLSSAADGRLPPSPAMPLVPSAAADVQSVLGKAWAALPAWLLAMSPLRLGTVATALLLIVLVVGTLRRAALGRRCAPATMSSEQATASKEMAGVAALVVVSEKGRWPRMTTLAVDAPMPMLYASEAPVSMAKLILSRQVSRRPSFPSPRRSRARISLPATAPHSVASPSAPLSPLGRWMARTDPHA